ncbi:MAG: GTP-binding protein, partial [Bacteroidota bacterium]|nr:GTP-binding protein [Bacteroidota bacterium]
MSSIPLQLVTGFLGSGKTTFLKNYLEKFSGGRKIGII